MRRIITATLAAAALATTAAAATTGTATAAPTATAPTVQTASLQPHEGDRNFDCRKHGNRTCGVTLDPKPDDGKRQSVHVNLVFNKAGDLVRAYTW